jgi:tetratricopeptide (TPR) repeat protein
MENFLRLMTLMVVMFLVTIFTPTIKAQVQPPKNAVPTTATTVNTQDIDYEVAPDGILKWSMAYWPKFQADLDLDKVKGNIATILNNDIEIVDLESKISGIPKKITIVDNGFELKIGREILKINLSDLDFDSPLGVKQGTSNNLNPVGRTYLGACYVETLVNGRITKTYFPEYKVQFNKNITFNFETRNLEMAKKMADNLFFIQHPVIDKKTKAELAHFEPLAASYHALKLKPPVSEDQRRYIVQANAANKLKQFSKAIELYNKAIDIDATAYPAAYLNVALLQAQKHKIYEAIYYMKKFLMLEPDSVDARSAQDKIYEWEGML